MANFNKNPKHKLRYKKLNGRFKTILQEHLVHSMIACPNQKNLRRSVILSKVVI